MKRFDVPAKLLVFIPPEFGGKHIRKMFLLAFGGRGGGKSWAAAIGIILFCLLRKTRVFVTRDTEKSIAESVIALFSDRMEELGVEDRFTITQKKIICDNGSEILWGGLGDPDALKSMEAIDLTWVEEAQAVSKKSLDKLLPTVMRSEQGSEVWFTFNPEDETDPVYSRFIIKDMYKDEKTVVKVGWEDNPFLSKRMLMLKDAEYASDPEQADWIWGGNIRKRSRAAVMADKCVLQSFTPGSDWGAPRFGLDFGFSHDPMVAIKCWSFGGCLWIEEESYGLEINTPEIPTFLLSRITGWWRQVIDPHTHRITGKVALPNVHFVADCSRPDTISDLNKFGVPTVGCHKWKGGVEDGIAALRKFKKIIVHERCKHFWEEAKEWKYKTDKDDNVLPILQAGNDHGWDAVRYAMEDVIMNPEIECIVQYSEPDKSLLTRFDAGLSSTPALVPEFAIW